MAIMGETREFITLACVNCGGELFIKTQIVKVSKDKKGVKTEALDTPVYTCALCGTENNDLFDRG